MNEIILDQVKKHYICSKGHKTFVANPYEITITDYDDNGNEQEQIFRICLFCLKELLSMIPRMEEVNESAD